MINKASLTIVVTLFITSATTSALTGGTALADSKNYRWKHDRVYEQRKTKNILSLEKILKIVRPRIKGELIETEFEFEYGIPIYEFKYISKTGRVMELYVNAKNGKIIKEEED